MVRILSTVSPGLFSSGAASASKQARFVPLCALRSEASILRRWRRYGQRGQLQPAASAGGRSLQKCILFFWPFCMHISFSYDPLVTHFCDLPDKRHKGQMAASNRQEGRPSAASGASVRSARPRDPRDRRSACEPPTQWYAQALAARATSRQTFH